MSNLSEAISEMRNMRESYNQIAGAAEAYNVGKTQLAAAITSKGVETSPTETYPEMAEKVNTISQETYEINGGEMYAKQLFGSLETPNYWNLYDVLTQLLSDGRLVNYGGILLAEYYRGYDSLALAGAGAGGAYVVSDLDENGQFKMYTSDTTHTWATEFDGKGNRWVAYCFADEYHDFQITDTNTSPRSIYIGRNIGTIESLVNGRVSEIVVTDGNVLSDFNTGQHTQNFGKNAILRLSNVDSDSIVLFNPTNTELIYFEGKISGRLIRVTTDYPILNTVIIKGEFDDALLISCDYNFNSGIKQIIVDGSGRLVMNRYDATLTTNNLYVIATVKDTLKLLSANLNVVPKKIFIKHTTTTQDFVLQHQDSLFNSWKLTEDVELQDGWCSNMDISVCVSNNLTEEKIYAHILQRLKQDEPDCGDGVTITLGSTNLAKLTSEESVQLLDDLTNIYGYTFA